MKSKTSFFLGFFTLILNSSTCHDVEKLTILMPNVQPKPEQYLCTSVKIDADKSYYIVGFELKKLPVLHHLLLFGCSKPGSDEATWECGQNSVGTCKETPQIIAAFTHNFKLPDGVGFRIGKNSDVQYIVLQVHYKDGDHLKKGITDHSGFVLNVTSRSLTKSAGFYSTRVLGDIPPHSTEHLEAACTLLEEKTLHPLFYEVHTHKLGKVVSAYVVKNNEWFELGKADPVISEFLDTHYNGTINPGDKIAVRCTMQSDRNHWTHSGFTHEEEMCNFYLMYYVENSKPLDWPFCTSVGPPKYYWHTNGLSNIPNEEASTF